MRRVMLMLVMTLVASIALAQDAQDGQKKKPTEQEMMEAMMKYGTPGEEHKKLAMMAGTFDAECTMKMSPEAPEVKSKGKSVNEMLFDGRYLQSKFEGDFAGMPFKGISVMAFDKMSEKYVNTWIDSMSTMVMVAEGKGSGNVITVTCSMDCPVRKEKISMRQVLTITDKDNHTLEAFCTEGGGKEYKSMTIKYTRAKDATAGK